MKKIYLLLFCITMGFFATAQNSSTQFMQKHEFIHYKIKSDFSTQPKGVVLWENQFDTASHWILDNSCAYSAYNIVGGYDYANQTVINAPSACTSPGTIATDPGTGNTAQWTFSTSSSYPSGIQGGTPFTDFNSSSATNGYLFIDSDALGGGDLDGTPIFVTATIATPIDLTGESNVVLSFSHNYRWWQDTRGVRVSGDNGATWVQYEITNNSGYPNDQNSGNPEITRIDVSADVGGQSQVLIQFYYEDNDYWAWYWAVDDVKITRKDLNNIQANSAYVYGESLYGAEYGRIPLDEVDARWVLGAVVSNDGVNDQTNVTLDTDFGSFTTSTSFGIVESDSTSTIESLEPLTLTTGVYQGTFTVSSDSDQVGGANFGDNTFERNFEVTSGEFSLDGIGLHPAGQEVLTGIGTASFTGGEDGLVCANYYPLKQTQVINSVHVEIDGDNSFAGAEIILYVIDSLSFTSGAFGNAVFTSDLYSLTTNDVSVGYFDMPTSLPSGWDPVNNTSTWENLNLSPGGYYVGVELFSGGGTYDVTIVDDVTVGQPAWSSAVWIPQDQAYTNGNAFAIRLNFGANVGINENVTNNVSIYPNPTSDVLNISTNSNDLSELIIKDITGKIVFNKNFNTNITVNTENYAKGVYLINVKNNLGTVSEKITVQ
ncbi:MAG: T9SS type A sorting domain-containing protein [Parvicellaceae bacterium]